MFYVDQQESSIGLRRPTVALLVFNVAALLIALWVMFDLLREQETVRTLMKELPATGARSAQELASEMLWQFRMSFLLLINLITTAIGVVLLWRAYHVSVESLLDIRSQANDILGSMDQAVITTDLNAMVTSINPAGMKLFPNSELSQPRKLAEVVDVKEMQDLQSLAVSGREGFPWRDLAIERSDGILRMRVHCQPLLNRSKKKIGNIFQIRDVTEIVLVEERMRRMERYMGLGDLLAGLYHEIKNPLAAFSLHVQLLSERLEKPPVDAESAELLQVIQNELARMSGVLESFRDYASTSHLNKSYFDLLPLLQRQLKLLAPRAESSNIDVVCDWEVAVAMVFADEMKIEQVMINLLINAFDAMAQGGKLIVRVYKHDHQIVVDFEDTGHGIPESIRRRIFDPYFTTKSNGIGMGLALCEKLVRQHDGNLSYRPRAEGSLFRLTLAEQVHTQECESLANE